MHEGKSRPIRGNPLITRALYHSKDMKSFATGLKRIMTAFEKAGCKAALKTKGMDLQESEVCYG